MVDTLSAILTLACCIFCWVLYHQIFDVIYFDFQRGCMTEIIGSIIAGALLSALIIMFWWVAAIICGIAAFVSFSKGKNGTAALCVAMLIASAILGITYATTGQV